MALNSSGPSGEGLKNPEGLPGRAKNFLRAPAGGPTKKIPARLNKAASHRLGTSPALRRPLSRRLGTQPMAGGDCKNHGEPARPCAGPMAPTTELPDTGSHQSSRAATVAHTPVLGLSPGTGTHGHLYLIPS